MERIRMLQLLLAASNACCLVYSYVAIQVQSRQTRQYTRRFDPRSKPICFLAEQQPEGSDFWSQQKALMQEMTESADRSLSQEKQDQYNKQLVTLISDTAFIGFYIFCALWTVFENPLVAFSYAFGTTLGSAYAYGLGKYVETVGGVTTESEAIRGAGVGQARFAFLILLFIFVGKFRSSGLMEVPAILGFFTYQLGSLVQALRAPGDSS